MYEYHYWHLLNNLNCEVCNFPIQRGELGGGWRLLPFHSYSAGSQGLCPRGLLPLTLHTAELQPSSTSDTFKPLSQFPQKSRCTSSLVFGLIVLVWFYSLILVLHNEKIWSPSANHMLSSLSLRALPMWGGEVSNGLSHMWFVLGAPYPGTWDCLRKGRWAKIRTVPMLVLL